MVRPPLALCLCLASGCAYLSDEDEARRLDPDGDGVLVGDDCDDRNASVGLPVPWFLDEDGDGVGAADALPRTCAPPDGAVAASGDCDDADPSVYPGAADAWYDGVDSDCAGDNDYDQDRDGYASADHTGDDCNDANPAVHPGASEVEGNGLDDDCSGDANGNRWEGAGGWSDAAAVWTGSALSGQSDLAGFAVAAAGDINGDGGADFMVAAPQGPQNATWLVSGTGAAGGELAREAQGLRTNSEEMGVLGLAPLGDINGDGYDDVAVGEYLASWYTAQAGVVWVVLGPVSVDVGREGALWELSDVAFLGPYSGASVGASLSGGSDLTADGVSDLLIGAPFDVSTSRPGGRVWVAQVEGVGGGWAFLDGTPSLTADAGLGGWFGWDTAVGDLNGDGMPDAVVGAPNADPSGELRNAGAVYLFEGPITEDRDAVDGGGATLSGAAGRDGLGTALGTADVDGDGFDDLVVAARGAVAGAGEVYVVPGPLTADGSVRTEAVLTLQGDAESNFGNGLDLGDPDRDGRVDLVVGAPGVSPDAGEGRVWTFYRLADLAGGTHLAAEVADGSFGGGAAGSAAGTSVALVGDTDQDGYGDLLVGAPGAVDGAGGSVALFLGGAL